MIIKYPYLVKKWTLYSKKNAFLGGSKIKIFRIFEKLALFTPNTPVFQLIIKIHVYFDVCVVQWVSVHRGTVARFWLPKWALHTKLLNTDAEKSQ